MVCSMNVLALTVEKFIQHRLLTLVFIEQTIYLIKKSMGPLSRDFFKECSLKRSLPRLSSPASDLSSPLSTGDLRLTSPHRRLERLLKFPSPRVD